MRDTRYDLRTVISFRESYYEVLEKKIDHTRAEAAAKALYFKGAQGSLVTVGSRQENEFLLKSFGGGVWIGGHDKAAEDTWVWQGGASAGMAFWNGRGDGTAVNGAYTNWVPGEPNDAGQVEDCMHTNEDGTWNDNSCDTSFMAVIEYQLQRIVYSNEAAYEFLEGGSHDYEKARTLAGQRDLGEVVGHLVVVNTDSEAAFLAAAYGAEGKYWLDVVGTKAGDWRWASGLFSGTQFWAGGKGGTATNGLFAGWADAQPAIGPTCAVSGGGASATAQWQVAKCDVTAPNVIVEYDLRDVLALNSAAYMMPPGRKTHADALVDAASRTLDGVRGHLLVVSSQQEADAVYRRFGNGMWAAGHDLAQDGRWVWQAGPEKGQTLWIGEIDGKPVPGVYSSWSKNEPNNAFGGEGCMELGVAENWNDNNCNTLLSYVVEFQPRQVISIGSSSFELLPASTYDDAVAAASVLSLGSIPAAMVSILTADESAVLQERFGASAPFWLGATKDLSGTWAWPAGEGQHAVPLWQNGQAVADAYTNWVGGQPSGSGECALSGGDIFGTGWSPTACGGPTKYNVVLRYSLRRFHTFQGSTYEVLPSRETFNDALDKAGQQTYKGVQGHMATLGNAEENEFLRKSFGGQFWAAGQLEAASGAWAWQVGAEKGQVFWRGGADGAGVADVYSNWWPGEPNNLAGGEGCLEVREGGEWNDLPCSSRFRVIVEYPERTVFKSPLAAYELVPELMTYTQAVEKAKSSRLDGIPGEVLSIYVSGGACG